MTIAEQLHEEGRQQGHQQGLEQGLQQGLKQGLEQGRRQGQKQGRRQGLEHGRHQALVTALRTLLIGKFHALSVRDEARLRAATAETLERYLQRVLSARSRADVFID